MIEIRRELLCRMPLGPSHMDIKPEDLTFKVKQVLQEVAVDIPIMNDLRSCTVETKVEARNDQLYVNVYLQEITQLSLFISQGSGKARQEEQDPFTLEWSQAVEERENASRRIEIVTGIAPHTLDVNKPSSLHAGFKTLRRSITRRLSPLGVMHVVGLPEPVAIQIDKPPRILAEGVELTITAIVNALTRKRALLGQVSLEAVGCVPRDAIFQMPEKIYLFRAGVHKLHQSGTRLQIAMDTCQLLKLKVLMTFDWVDGSPSHLELIEVLC